MPPRPLKRKATPPAPRRKPVFAQALDVLGRRIVGGYWPPGVHLPPEPELGAELSVSRGPLREAVKTLVAKGFLEIGPRNGTLVRPRLAWNFLDVDVLRWLNEVDHKSLLANLNELRATIEPGAASLAALRATAADRAALTAAYEALERSQHQNVDAFIEADLAFHTALLRACHNDLFNSLGKVLEFVLREAFTEGSTVPGAVAASIPQHGLIVAAITAGDAASAAAAASRLITMAGQHLQAASKAPSKNQRRRT